MDTIAHYLEMGGYARFVWPAYGVAVIVLAGMAIASVAGWRRQQRLWAALEAAGHGRRRSARR
ncbi:MAG TPA: heme exporter protein CcmD [Stellaceae bacterium]|nr:heme exporter protein CcmD [Stellaceae bacterium]